MKYQNEDRSKQKNNSSLEFYLVNMVESVVQMELWVASTNLNWRLNTLALGLIRRNVGV